MHDDIYTVVKYAHSYEEGEFPLAFTNWVSYEFHANNFFLFHYFKLVSASKSRKLKRQMKMMIGQEQVLHNVYDY